MNPEKITEGNKLIAKFMGAKKTGSSTGLESGGVANEYEVKISEKITSVFYDKEGAWTDFKEMKFHESWDWIMPVIKKIEGFGYFTQIDSTVTRITEWKDKYEGQNSADPISYHVTNLQANGDKLLSTWLTVLGFIDWYKKKK